jgi:hypothetical protein
MIIYTTNGVTIDLSKVIVSKGEVIKLEKEKRKKKNQKRKNRFSF